MVASGHAKPWKKQWGDDDEHFSEHIGGTFQKLRREYAIDAEFTAANLEADASIVRKIF